MTTPVTPPAKPTVPTYPQLGSPTFNQEAYAVGAGMPAVVDGIDALAENAFVNATAANEGAVTSVQAANSAAASAASAAAASNFKNWWVNLSGPLSMPASVKHNGRFWYLLQNVADVTAHEPAENAYWTASTTGTLITQAVTGDVNPAVPGVTYIFAVATAKVTLPPPGGLEKGAGFGFRAGVALSPNQKIKLNGAKLFGKTVEDDEIFMDVVALDINLDETAYGYI